MDRVQLTKYESTALGGQDSDALPYPAPLDPQEDATEVAGVYLQDVSNRDEAVLISRSGDDMTFKDVNNSGGLTLSQLVRSVSKVGTPANNQLAVWTGDGTLEGESELTYDGSTLTVSGDISCTNLSATKAEVAGPIRITEVASPDADEASKGQIWCKDNTPNDLYFRDDEGNDHLLSLTEADYAKLTGRSGGQTLQGGTEASQDLTLVSTASATRGHIYLGAAQTSAFDETTGWLGIGIAAPDTYLHVHKSSAGTIDAHSKAVLVLEAADHQYINFLSSATREQGILFGEVGDSNIVAGIYYGHGTDQMFFSTADNSTALTLESDQDVTCANALTVGSAASAATGAIQWTGSNFQGYTGSAWVNLDTQGGDVSVSGTPVDNQLAIWTGASTIEGDGELTYDGNVLTCTTRAWVKSTGSGATAITNGMGGLELSAVQMDTTNKYTTAVKFMSTDASLTTENPKLGAVIVGRATEAYAADTDGGMAIDFAVTADDPGTTNVPAVGMSLTSTGLGIGIDSPDTYLHVQKSSAGSIDPSSKALLVLEAADHAYINFLGSATREQGIIFGEVGDSNTVGGIFYGHSDDSMYFTVAGGTTAANFDSSGNVRLPVQLMVGTAGAVPDTTLHVFENTAGAVTPLSGTAVTIESSAAVYLSFLTPNTVTAAGVLFGDPEDNDVGSVTYNHVTNTLSFTDGTTGTKTLAELAAGGGGDVSVSGTPVDNQVAVWTGASTIEGDADLVWTGTGFGIGTNSPGKLCHIEASDTGTTLLGNTPLVVERSGNCNIQIASNVENAGSITFTDSTDTTQGKIAYDHDSTAPSMSLWTDSVEAVRITSAQNVGINETAPLGRLHVKDSDTGVASLGANYSTLVVEDNTSYAGVTVVSNAAHLAALVFTDVANTFRGFVGYDHGATLTDALQLGTAGSIRMTIDSTGQVGIGTTSLISRFHVETTTTDGQQAVTIDQKDTDQPFIDYRGTSAANTTNSITSYSTPGSVAGHIKIEINGTTYWMPYYGTPSA